MHINLFLPTRFFSCESFFTQEDNFFHGRERLYCEFAENIGTREPKFNISRNFLSEKLSALKVQRLLTTSFSEQSPLDKKLTNISTYQHLHRQVPAGARGKGPPNEVFAMVLPLQQNHETGNLHRKQGFSPFKVLVLAGFAPPGHVFSI